LVFVTSPLSMQH